MRLPGCGTDGEVEGVDVPVCVASGGWIGFCVWLRRCVYKTVWEASVRGGDSGGGKGTTKRLDGAALSSRMCMKVRCKEGEGKRTRSSRLQLVKAPLYRQRRLVLYLPSVVPACVSLLVSRCPSNGWSGDNQKKWGEAERRWREWWWQTRSFTERGATTGDATRESRRESENTNGENRNTDAMEVA